MLEPFEELDDELPEELELPEPAEPGPALPEPAEPDPELPEGLDVLPGLDTPEEVPVEWDDELFVEGTDECVEPGSVAATAPATATLAKLTAAVVAFSR
ncbi:MAG TPA: hypothetical protein VF482_05325 [Trebonia sp.]